MHVIPRYAGRSEKSYSTIFSLMNPVASSISVCTLWTRKFGSANRDSSARTAVLTSTMDRLVPPELATTTVSS